MLLADSVEQAAGFEAEFTKLRERLTARLDKLRVLVTGEGKQNLNVLQPRPCSN